MHRSDKMIICRADYVSAGHVAPALFNIERKVIRVQPDLQLHGPKVNCKTSDIWAQREISFQDGISIPFHGCIL